MNAYISIGNSDDKLTQREWALFIADIRWMLGGGRYPVHGEWFSSPESGFQNACWCIEISPKHDYRALRESLRNAAAKHRQEAIALALAEPEFLGVPLHGPADPRETEAQ